MDEATLRAEWQAALAEAARCAEGARYADDADWELYWLVRQHAADLRLRALLRRWRAGGAAGGGADGAR